MKRRFLFLLLVGLLLPRLSAKTLILNVATNGNDAWSGGRAIPSATQDDGPLATLAAALQKVRRAFVETPEEYADATVLLREGTYTQDEPIVLGPEHSGPSRTHPLVIAAYPGERPVISGGRRITGWRRLENKPDWWQVTLPEVRDGRWSFRELFVNGERKRRARTPNQGFFRIQGDSSQDKPFKLKFKPGDIKKEWATNDGVEVVAYLNWADLHMPIRAVDETNAIATLSGDPRPSNREKDAQYFVENSPDLLDVPGEWYLDRKTGVLTYCADPAVDLTQAEVIAPRLEELLILKGDPTATNPVRNVVLRGLTFTYTDQSLPPAGYADTQAAVDIRGDIRAEAATDCTVEDCVFTHLSGYALELGRGCQRWKIIGNELVDLGAGGIRIGEVTPAADPVQQCAGHTVTDNHLYQLGRTYASGGGIFVMHSGNNRIAHNRIHDLYYTAISVGWEWGYQETPCHDNVIEFNELFDIGQARLSDMGAIYTLGIQRGTVVRNNLIHDVNAFTYGGWGLYTDEGSSYITLENNVVYRCKSAGFHQHYGRENVVQNNIFAFNTEHQLMRSREEEHRSFSFERNIVYFDSGDLLGSTWTNNRFWLDNNVYFDARPEARLETMRFAGATFAEWQARGHDRHSVIADPLFYNPTAFNFRLNDNSPALRLGFKSIDLSKVGIRRRGQRTNP